MVTLIEVLLETLTRLFKVQLMLILDLKSIGFVNRYSRISTNQILTNQVPQSNYAQVFFFLGGVGGGSKHYLLQALYILNYLGGVWGIPPSPTSSAVSEGADHWTGDRGFLLV